MLNIIDLEVDLHNIDEMVIQDFINIFYLTPDNILRDFKIFNFNVDNLHDIVLRYIKDINDIKEHLEIETISKIKKYIENNYKLSLYSKDWLDFSQQL